MRNETTIGGIVVGGQPDAADLARFATVINVRLPDEPGNVTTQLLEGSGKTYAAVPYTGDTLRKEHVEEIRRIVESADGPVLLH